MLKTAPREVVEPVEAKAQGSEERVSCPTCDKTFHGGMIVSDYVGIDHTTHHYQAVRRLFCDHCRKIVTWFERVESRCRDEVDLKLTAGRRLTMSDFRTTGHVLYGPYDTTGRQKIEQFLADHPEAAGVCQS